ncbi:MAG: glutamate racemase [Peptococcaceae bacterium]|nr:glutamate racemase [Peptococcaceae bacterium]
MKIAIFDSGIGGLTVLHQALQQMPQEDYLYYADTLHVPYGTKTKEEIISCVDEAVAFIAEQDVKALVVACNTATSVAIAELRQKYTFPIIGMEPAVKPAVSQSQKRVLVIATPMTLQEQKLHDLLLQIDMTHIVDLLPLPQLVTLAEDGIFSGAEVETYLQKEFGRYALEDYDTVVLGCTHFNFFKDTLRRLLPGNISLLDGSNGTVKHLQHLLAERGLGENNNGQVTYYQSGKLMLDTTPYEALLSRLDQMQQY